MTPQPLRVYLAAQFTALLADRRFLDALPGHLPGDAISQDRLPDLRQKFSRWPVLPVNNKHHYG